MNTSPDPEVIVDTTIDLDNPTWQRGGKAFATLVAQFSLTSYQLTRTDSVTGQKSKIRPVMDWCATCLVG